MATLAWMDLSLGRSSRLALQVLERAQKRRVDWQSRSRPSDVQVMEDKHGSSRGPLPHSRNDAESAEHACLNHAFDTIKEFMANTTCQCQTFYSTIPVQAPTEYEVNHVCRYHSRRLPETSQRNIPKSRDQARTPEDFVIEVSPGTYAVTASAENAGRRTELVQINAGQSVNLTFHL